MNNNALAHSNLKAIALMILAMGLFAIEDSIIKIIAEEISAGQILLVLSAVGFLTFALVAKLQGHRLLTADLLTRPMILRNLGDVFGALCFVTALTLMPLSNVSAILQATPLLVTLGAALVLREAVGWRRWCAILIGFIGVLIIIRPGMEGFNAASILALLGTVGLSVRDLATRRIRLNISTMVVSTAAYFALVIPSYFLMLFTGGWQPMSERTIIYMIAACIVGPFSYYAITLALRLGEMSAIAPFRYTRLIFAIILGFVLFDEVPDLWMIIGSIMVIGTGIYAIYRERIVNQRVKQAHAKTIV